MVNKVLNITPCAWPYCKKEGRFSAPCDPRNLRKRIILCDEHIITYNKSWNGLDGFTAEEIFNMQENPAWDKPTWKLGEKQKLQEEIFNFTHGSDKSFKGYDFFSDDMPIDHVRKNLKMPKEVQEAMDILETYEPLEMVTVKKAYKKKVKENHPDRTKNKLQAEENLKQINLAYHKLKNYLKIKI
ncbi:MAG TPA: hypothetical protein DCL21_04085 [Alphaproteobacteria bacterium]|nr:hypothetical protein [Alphaproteobacteria bacterium]